MSAKEAAAAAKRGVTRGVTRVGKAELALLLGWSRPKLDRRLEGDPNFPVLTRGTKAGGWEFDPVAVKQYVDGESPAPAAEIAPAPKPRRGKSAAASDDTRPQSPLARRTLAQAELAELQLALKRGDYVERDRVLTVMATAFTRLGKALEMLPGQLAREFNWPPEQVRLVRARLDEFRRAFARDAREFQDVTEPGSERDTA